MHRPSPVHPDCNCEIDVSELDEKVVYAANVFVMGLRSHIKELGLCSQNAMVVVEIVREHLRRSMNAADLPGDESQRKAAEVAAHFCEYSDQIHRAELAASNRGRLC